jgi:hypothetical protein
VSKRAIVKEPWKFVFGFLAVVLVVVTGGNALFPLLLLFITLGLARWVVGAIRRWGAPEEKYTEEQSIEPTSVDS